MVEEIKHYCQIYGFTYEVLSENHVKIKSKYDEWVIHYYPHKGYNFVLFHLSCFVKNYKTVHKQREYYDLQFLFESIYKHDSYRERRFGFGGGANKKRRNILC